MKSTRSFRADNRWVQDHAPAVVASNPGKPEAVAAEMAAFVKDLIDDYIRSSHGNFESSFRQYLNDFGEDAERDRRRLLAAEAADFGE